MTTAGSRNVGASRRAPGPSLAGPDPAPKSLSSRWEHERRSTVCAGHGGMIEVEPGCFDERAVTALMACSAALVSRRATSSRVAVITAGQCSGGGLLQPAMDAAAAMPCAKPALVI